MTRSLHIQLPNIFQKSKFFMENVNGPNVFATSIYVYTIHPSTKIINGRSLA